MALVGYTKDSERITSSSSTIKMGPLPLETRSDCALPIPSLQAFSTLTPQAKASLPLGPLDNPEIAYYYHPEAADGFTKRLDLYSLGVVLCEIGRWELIPYAMAPKKQKLADRVWALDFLSKKPLEDLGWRMGVHYREAVQALLMPTLPKDENQDIFAQQYFEKVLRLLDSCNARGRTHYGLKSCQGDCTVLLYYVKAFLS